MPATKRTVFPHLRQDPISLTEAHAIVAAVRGTEGVADLSSGSFGEVALLYPEARVPGLKVSTVGTDQPRLAVHICVDLRSGLGNTSPKLSELAENIRQSVRQTGCTELPIDVVFADAATSAASAATSSRR